MLHLTWQPCMRSQGARHERQYRDRDDADPSHNHGRALKERAEFHCLPHFLSSLSNMNQSEIQIPGVALLGIRISKTTLPGARRLARASAVLLMHGVRWSRRGSARARWSATT